MRNVAVVALVAAVLGLVCGSARTAPKPSDIPVSWELEFKFDVPRPIRLEVPGQNQPATFWYMEYTVTNRTGNEQDFMPVFVLYTDTGQVLRAGQGVPGSVFQEIKATLGRPLLMDQADLSSKPLLRGENNARKGVMIFTDIDPKAGAFDIFIGGLSGEMVKIRPPNPVPTITYDDRTDKMKTEMVSEIVLVKTLQLSYSLPGEAAARFKTKAERTKMQWVMR
jgi:hypothetical protein